MRGDVRFHTDVIGDPVIVRADGTPAYNFAVVVDDALMAITHVIRGEDHISNTPRQMLLYEALGFTPPVFAHLALVLGPDHTPLSKRHGATSVAEFRAKGYLPEALVNYLALIGWSPRRTTNRAALPVDELARRFSLDEVGLSAGVFDEEKLAWVNRHYLKMADPPSGWPSLAVPFFQARWRGDDARRRRARVSGRGDADRVGRRSIGWIRCRRGSRSCSTTSPTRALADARGPRGDAAPTARARWSRALADVLAGRARLDRERFRAIANQVKAKTGQKGKALFHPIRVVLTGAPRAGAGSRRAGDRSRRRAAGERRAPADPRLPRARPRVRRSLDR